MTTNVTRRIVTALTGPAVAAGILAGGLALGAPAKAEPSLSMTTPCVTAAVRGMAAPNMFNPLTRPAQVAAYEAPSVPTPAATSCIGQ